MGYFEQTRGGIVNQHEQSWLLVGAIILAIVLWSVTGSTEAGWTLLGVSAVVYAIWHYRRRNRVDQRMKEMADK